MRPTFLLITTTILVVGMSAANPSGSARAAGPFNLFSRHGGCDSACDSSCDAQDGCSADAGCCAEASCVGGCDAPACDACCDASSRTRCSIGDLLKGCRSSDRCPDPCSYCSLFGGWNMLDDYSGEAQILGPPPPLRGTFNDGWMIGFAKGRRFNSAIRGELEFAFRSNTADQWSIGAATADWSGHLFGYTAMTNLVHDFKSWDLAGISPYVGAGIGLAILDGDFQTNMTRVEIDDEAFAYQFMIGGSKRVNRNVELFAEYRYFGTSGFDVVNVGAAPNVGLGTHEGEFDNVLVGLRINR